MDNPQTQLVEKLKTSTNILVTVSRNPTVDQLAACVGLTLLLNKFDKHATAVFSGEVPSTLEFLEPEQTLEKTTDSLRDFIIALDKTKADKLRYKVEDDMVRIFITPYRVSISNQDLEFSQGDFNVDVVLALGVTRQEDFDAAITAHGRILHDAVVSSIATTNSGELGSLNWSDPSASSLCELIVELAHGLGNDLMDPQIATALLTGIVSETERFSNEKTTPHTMSVSAELMAAGANQQLVATKLNQPATSPAIEPSAAKNGEASAPVEKLQSANGILEIDHDSIDAVLNDLDQSEPELTAGEPSTRQLITQDPAAELPEPVNQVPQAEPETSSQSSHSRMIIEPPTLGGTLTANSRPETLDPAVNPLANPSETETGLLNRTEPMPPSEPAPKKTITRQPEAVMTGFTPPPPSWVAATQDASNQFNNPVVTPVIDSSQTLAEIEAAVHAAPEASLDTARDEVMRALSSQPSPPEPIESLGAQPLGEPLRPVDTAVANTAAAPSFSDVLHQVIPPDPTGGAMPPPAPVVEQPSVTDPTAPPPVPPPIPFNFGSAPPPPQ